MRAFIARAAAIARNASSEKIIRMLSSAVMHYLSPIK
jgi:hypothetical protein